MSSFVSTLSTLSLKQGNWEEVDLSGHLGGQIELVCQPEHWVRKLRRGLPFCAARCQVLFDYFLLHLLLFLQLIMKRNLTFLD